MAWFYDEVVRRLMHRLSVVAIDVTSNLAPPHAMGNPASV